MESHWIRTLIGMEVREARKTALREGLRRGIMDVIQIPVNDNTGTEWADDKKLRTIRIQYNEKTGKVIKARVG